MMHVIVAHLWLCWVHIRVELHLLRLLVELRILLQRHIGFIEPRHIGFVEPRHLLQAVALVIALLKLLLQLRQLQVFNPLVLVKRPRVSALMPHVRLQWAHKYLPVSAATELSLHAARGKSSHRLQNSHHPLILFPQNLSAANPHKKPHLPHPK